MIQQFHFWVFMWREWNHYLEKISASMFKAALFTTAKTGKYVSIDGWMHKENVSSVAHKNQIIQPLKKGNPVICNKTDGSWGHYAKWNKLEKDRYCMTSYVESKEYNKLVNRRKKEADTQIQRTN